MTTYKVPLDSCTIVISTVNDKCTYGNIKRIVK